MHKAIIMLFLLFSCSVVSDAQNNIPQFQLNGNAQQLTDLCYRLTAAQNSQSGSAWCLNTISLTNSFDITISLNLGCVNANGADGIVFGFQPLSTEVGAIGGGLGFEGISPSIGIEFDTYQNGNNSDPAADHVAIIRNGNMSHSSPNNLAGPVQASPTSNDIEDCNEHLVRVTWNAVSQTLTVYFDCVERLSYTGDIVSNTFGGNPNVYWGFTASTGMLNNMQSVCLLEGSFFNTMPDTSICAGGSITLAAPEGTNYQWSPSSGLSNPNLQNPIASPSLATTYVVSYTLGCQTLTDTVLVDVVQSLLSIDAPAQLCEGQANVTLSVSETADTYQWSTGAATPSINTNTAGTYTVTVTNSGCTATAVHTIGSYPLPQPLITGNTDFCFGANTLLSVTPSSYPQYAWAGGGTNATQTFDSSQSVSVLVTDSNGCTATAAANVTEAPPILPQIVGDLSICQGESTNLLAGTYSQYQWSTGANSQSISPSTAADYSLTVTNADGCTGNTAVTVVVNSLPSATISGNTQICAGETAILSANAALAYVWSTGETDQNISVASSGIYTVTVSDSNACSASAQLMVNQYPTPTPIISGELSICAGSSTTLSTTNNYAQYAWNNGSTSAQISVATPQTYTITVTDTNACTATATAQVQAAPNPTPIIGGELSICEGYTTTLTADAHQTYLWSTNDTTASITLANAGTYTLTITDANGCGGTASVSVSLNPLPQPHINGNLTIEQQGDYTQLDAGSGYAAYNWSSGGETAVLQVTQAQTYTVTVTDTNGCTATATALVNIVPQHYVAIPNAFSPNNDNHNDFFGASANNVQTYHAIMYNRWGQMVFESHQIDDQWDGMFKGKLQEMGVYAYLIELLFTDGTMRNYKGNFTLIY